MSYTLSLPNSPTRRTTEILSDRLQNARCVENPEGLPDMPWPDGILHFFRDGQSTRGIELIKEGADLRVRIASMACPEDWSLAYEILSAFAGDPSATIEGEDGTASACGDLPGQFAQVASRETAAGLAAIETALSQNGGGEIRIPGPVRGVFIGPRLLGELAQDPAQRVNELFARMRRVQFAEREGYEFQSPVPLTAPGVPSFSVWSPAKAQAFEPVDAVGLSAPTGNLYIPVSELPAVVGKSFHWLDERQFAIDATTDPALIDRARRVSIDPYKQVAKKWWQVWRSN